MSRTIHGTNCWECSDFNVKNTKGYECEGHRHIFCDKSLEEHDAKVREDVIYEFAKWLEEKDYLNKTEIDYDWDEHSYLDIVSMTKEEILEEYMDWLATEKN